MSPALLNPYIVGGAISDAAGRGFFGREDVFEFVRLSLLSARRTPILLLGQRRIGKSSILRQLPRQLPADWVCVYYDLQGKAELELDQLLYGLARAIADALGMTRPMREEIKEDTFPRFLASTVEALGGRPERLVLLFDEFDVIDQQFTGPEIAAKRFISYLAELNSSFPNIGYVMVVGRRSSELSDSLHSAILKDSIQKPIGRLSREQVQKLVRDLAAGNLVVGDAELESIYSLTAGHPFAVQMLCHSLWNYIQKNGGPVTRVAVDTAFEAAVEVGTNGLNWIYDGLDKPAHRLFLSSIATLAGHHAMGTVSRREIEQALLKRHAAVDEGELRAAARDLQSWDVIDRVDDGYRIVVPMIGRWIQQNRPVAELEQETRLVNPRSARFYELGMDSYLSGDNERAIAEFRNALAENPVSIEAQLGLARALRSRGLPGDLDAAIEAYQRVRDLDPNSPATALLEALLESMNANRFNVERVAEIYKRILSLDPDPLFRDRATRQVQDMASIRSIYGTDKFLREAALLYTILKRGEEADRALTIARRVSKRNNWAVFLAFAFLALAFNPATQLGVDLPPLLRLAASVISGTLFGVVALIAHDGELSVRKLNLLGLAIGTLVGYVTLWLSSSLTWGSVAGFFAAVITGTTGASNPSLPDELAPPPDPEGRPLQENLASALDRLAAWLRSSKPTQSR